VFLLRFLTVIKMEISTVAFLTSTHSPFDDRIFYHQAQSLAKRFKVVIISSAETISETVGQISIVSDNSYGSDKKKKIEFFKQSLTKFNPELIICSEPLPILAARKYKNAVQQKVKIIYDVTEWYPSKKNLECLPLHKKIFTFLKLLIVNLYASSRCDGFIFGEYYKSLPYRFLFGYKRWEMVSYYPDLKYINYQESELNSCKICLGYAGKISVEKGIVNFFAVATALKRKSPGTAVNLKIIGWCLNETEKNTFDRLCREAENVEIEILGKQDFETFSDQLHNVDILFDLRKLDFENNRCLAIKVFYYAACGKPVIYSRIKAIKRDIDVNKFGYFVNPTDSELISDHIINYIENPDLYIQHSQIARKLAVEKYSWGILEPRFVDFISKF
jgi:glycosyltransferase involved in cell wall biosynthesis